MDQTDRLKQKLKLPLIIQTPRNIHQRPKNLTQFLNSPIISQIPQNSPQKLRKTKINFKKQYDIQSIFKIDDLLDYKSNEEIENLLQKKKKRSSFRNISNLNENTSDSDNYIKRVSFRETLSIKYQSDFLVNNRLLA